MAETNFVQFNPTQSNQQTDSQYQANELVTGGVQLNNPLPSAFLNKIWYQLSTFVSAFAQMLVNKGYSPVDTSESALAAVLANVLTNADTQPPILTVAYSPNAIFNRALGQGFVVYLTGPLSFTLTGQQPGQYITFLFVQDAVGGRAVTFPLNIGGAGTIDNTAPASALYQQ